jgi:hypothetical protein
MQTIPTHNQKSFFDINLQDMMWKHIIPVATAGMIDRALFHPWETVITVKQDSGSSIRLILKDYLSSQRLGFAGLYKGYLPNIMAAIPIRVSIFGTYSLIKEQGQYTTYSPTAISLGAGFTTGFLESTILCPVDAYRVRKTLKETAHESFHSRFLFKGYSSLLLRTSVENTICLLGTDLLMKQVSAEAQKHPATRYACAFFAGAASQLVSTPFDTIKTRKMKCPDMTYGEACQSLWKEGGAATFFRSAGTKAARAGVCNAMLIGTSVLLREALNHENNSCSL